MEGRGGEGRWLVREKGWVVEGGEREVKKVGEWRGEEGMGGGW